MGRQLRFRFAAALSARLTDEETMLHADRTSVRVQVELALPLRGGNRMICAKGPREARVDAALVTALRKAHRLTRREQGIPLVDAAPASQYDRMVLRLAFLAPNLQRDILAGRQPPELNLERMRKVAIPLDWNRQREALGWPT